MLSSDGTAREIPDHPKPLFQSEAKCVAVDIKFFFFILMQIKLIFTRKVLQWPRFETERCWNSEMAY